MMGRYLLSRAAMRQAWTPSMWAAVARVDRGYWERLGNALELAHA